MRVLLVMLVLTVPPRMLPAHAVSPCLHFEPTVESIVGTLVTKTFPGPPNYESVQTGDSPETYWLVKLTKPVCLLGRPDDELNSEDVDKITLVQLVVTSDEYKTHRRLLGKKVRATGSFYAAHTGHHHTPVLLQVTSLELVE